jgi:hypothetical protein
VPRQLRDLLAADPDVAARLSDESLAACFDESHFLRNVATAIARLDELAPAGEAPAGEAPAGGVAARKEAANGTR